MPSLNCPIVSFFHCRNCIQAGRKDKIAAGVTVTGAVTVWCEACDREVTTFDVGWGDS